MESTPVVTPPNPTPTQVKKPLRSTIRSVFQGVLGFAVVAPIIVATLDLDKDERTGPYVVSGLAGLGAFARLMATPQVEKFLQNHFSWLSATTKD